MRRLAVLIVTSVLSASFLSGAASAETLRAEGELRTRDAGWCAPDGERMMPLTMAGASGGQGLFYPHHGCWAEWDVDAPLRSISLVSLHPTAGGSGVRECLVFDVAVDGRLVGSTGAQCGDPGDAAVWEVLPAVDGLTITPGRHTIRVTMRITRGPSWANGYVDYLSIVGVLPGSPSEPRSVSARWELPARRVVLGWDSPATSGDAPITGYRVYRADGDKPEQRVAEVGDVRTFVDTSVAPGHTYAYRVTAVNEIGEGLASARATVRVPGGLLFSREIPAGPQQPVRVAELKGQNRAGLYCITAAVGPNPPSDLACVNLFGAPVPDTPAVVVEIPAGATLVLEGRYYYEPERLVTAATIGGDRAVFRLPAGPDDGGWLAENAAFVSLDVTAGPQGGSTLSVPGLGQLLGALHESSALGIPLAP